MEHTIITVSYTHLDVYKRQAVNYTPENVSASIALKVPGNDAKRYPLTLQQLDNSNFE